MPEPKVTCPTCQTQMVIENDIAECRNPHCPDRGLQRMWTDDQQLIADARR